MYFCCLIAAIVKAWKLRMLKCHISIRAKCPRDWFKNFKFVYFQILKSLQFELVLGNILDKHQNIEDLITILFSPYGESWSIKESWSTNESRSVYI